MSEKKKSLLIGVKMDNEIWKDIPNYEGIYQVSNLGNIKSLSRTVLNKGKFPFVVKEKIIKNYLNKKGYYCVKLYKNGKEKNFRVHQILALAFLNHKCDGSNMFVVDHKNEIKTDNRLENLQIISNRENCSKGRLILKELPVGVSKHSNCDKYVSQIQINGKNTYLGLFDTPKEASQVYQDKLKLLK